MREVSTGVDTRVGEERAVEGELYIAVEEPYSVVERAVDGGELRAVDGGEGRVVDGTPAMDGGGTRAMREGTERAVLDCSLRDLDCSWRTVARGTERAVLGWTP